jgi:hypothetical protein
LSGNAIPLKPALLVDDCSTLLLQLYTQKTRLTLLPPYSIIRKWIVKDALITHLNSNTYAAVVTTDIAITEIKSFNIVDV